MPITYEAPSPVSAANLYSRRGGGGGGGGGYGGGGVGPVFQIQDDTAKLQNQMALVGMEGANRISQINAQGNVSGALQENAAYLDAWQFQQKVTAQESAQYRQDMNSIAAIDADPSMTPAEKQQAKLRIKTRVDWVGERQKRDMMEAQAQQAKAHADLFTMQANLEQQRQVNATALMSGKIHTMIRPDAVEEVNAEVRDMGVDPTSKEGQELQKKIAGQKGALFYFPISKDGVIGKDPIPFDQLAAAGKAGGAGTPGARGGTGGKEMSEAQYVDIRERAHKMAVEEAKLTPGATVSDKRVDEIEERLKKGQSEFSAHTPEGKAEAQRQLHGKALEGLSVAEQMINATPNFTPQMQKYGRDLVAKAKNLMTKYPPGKRSATMAEHINEILDKIEQLKYNADQRMRTPAEQAQQAQPGRPAGGGGVTIGPESSLPGQETLGAIGNWFGRTAGAIGDVAKMVGGGG